jgi:hypothetical protein
MQAFLKKNHFVCDGFAITNASREQGSRRARLAKGFFGGGYRRDLFAESEFLCNMHKNQD